jgi:tetratricopeptide (TPR) repeat protein
MVIRRNRRTPICANLPKIPVKAIAHGGAAYEKTWDWFEQFTLRGCSADMNFNLSQLRAICLRSLTFVGSISTACCLIAQSPQTDSIRSDQAFSPAVATDPATQKGIVGVAGAQFNGDISRASYSVARTDISSDRTSHDVVAPQAQAHINYALNLAERGAVQSARAEFTIALDLIADAIDADTHNTSREHARAVKAGLTAIEETKDLVPSDTPHDIEINIAHVSATHQTPVLRNTDKAHLTRAEALQHYHTYATQQLAFAGGHSAIASSALYGLGRAESLTGAGASAHNRLSGPNAMALFQAALIVRPQNYMAANELAVLSARYGDLNTAETQLVHSLSIQPRTETWHNLAAVYRREGQIEKAEQAELARKELIANPRPDATAVEDSTDLGSRPVVRCLEVDEFTKSGAPEVLDGPQHNSKTPQANQNSISKRLISKLIPWQQDDKASKTKEPTK